MRPNVTPAAVSSAACSRPAPARSASAARRPPRRQPRQTRGRRRQSRPSSWSTASSPTRPAGTRPWPAAKTPVSRSSPPRTRCATLAGDSAYVASVVDTIPGPVILVGHSYGGEVITNAGRGHTNVKALVYVAAFAPDEGESALQLAEQFPGSQLPGALLTRPFPLPGSAPASRPRRLHRPGEVPRGLRRRPAALRRPRLMAAAQRPGSVGGSGGPGAAYRRGSRCRPGTSSRPPTRSSRPPCSASWHSGRRAGSSRSRAPRTS